MRPGPVGGSTWRRKGLRIREPGAPVGTDGSVSSHVSVNPHVSVRWRIVIGLLRRLPQGALSRGWGWLAERRFPTWLQRRVNESFAGLMGVDVEEAERPPADYASLSDFFVRRLRQGRRAWPEDAGVPGSPVDGVVGSFGRLDAGTALQAKGVRYEVRELLAGEASRASFARGYFITIYLSPRHYHRIHAPIGGRLTEARAVPGRLLPVNRAAVQSVVDLFPRNERLVVLGESCGIATALVAIGAYNVGRISADFDPSWNAARGGGVTNRPAQGAGLEVRSYDPPLAVMRGQDLMAFHLGSTIVLLIDGARGNRREDGDTGAGADLPPFHPDLREGAEIRLGAPLLAGPLPTDPVSPDGMSP